MRRKRSIIWKMPTDEFKTLVKNSNSISQILKHFDFDNKGGNYKTVKLRCIKEDIDLSHIKLGLGSNKGRKFKSKKTPLNEMFIENSTFNRTHLKERIISENLLKYICNKCGNEGIWQNEKLVLQLEHKNGNGVDNRIENLCFLCPNCHSQTKTFCGKKKHNGG